MEKSLNRIFVLYLILVWTIPVTLSAQIINNLAVQHNETSTFWEVQTDLQIDDEIYGDRTHRLEFIPPYFAGSEWIRTAADSRDFSGKQLATFSVLEDVDVFIVYDDRIDDKPAWLRSWSKQNYYAYTKEGSNIRNFSLFHKCFRSDDIVTIGENGSDSFSMYIVVVVPAGEIELVHSFTPRIDIGLSAHPIEIEPGDSTILSWNIINANSASFDHGIGSVQSSGNLVVHPTETTTYTLSAENADGAASERVRVIVKPAVEPGPYQFTLQAIDHWNLRYFKENDFTLEEQAKAIKRNMDVLSRLGFSSYLIFAREDVFESMLDYDFEVEGIGNIGEKAGWRANQRARDLLQSIIEYGKEIGMDVYFHSNQLYFPNSILFAIGGVNAHKPPTETTWEIYRKKMQGFFETFPDLAGIQITGDETMINLEEIEQINRLTNETADAAGPDRRVLMRTWQRIGELGHPDSDPDKMFNGIRENVDFSIKNTRGDFRLENGFDVRYMDVADPTRVIIEFDAWREYENHNIFPFYLGDYWDPRFDNIADNGFTRIAVRLNWNSGYYPLIERPWTNWVNIHMFLGFAADPYADADNLLQNCIEHYYPTDSWEAAFELYKHTEDYIRRLYYTDTMQDIADHGRVNRGGRVREYLDNSWFVRVDQAYYDILEKINALPAGTPYKEELKKEAQILAYVSKGIAIVSDPDGMAAIILDPNKRNYFKTDWFYFDRESYNEMRGHNILGPFRDITVPVREVKKTYKPDGFKLYENYPNPFNPSTRIKFSLPVQSHVHLEVYDLLGRRNNTLVDAEKRPGSYIMEFNAKGLSSGFYIYRLQAGDFVDQKRMLFIK